MFDGKAEQMDTVRRVVATSHRGILKRIDENRELLELLQHEAPSFLEKYFYVEGWLKGQDGFLCDLLATVPVENRPALNGVKYPRPYPIAVSHLGD